MTAKKKDTSHTESVYRALHSDLVTCRLVPGSQLKTNDLAQRYGVGLSAVREALARLSSEGLVDASPQRGFRATPISAEKLQDLTTVRIDIEVMCMRQSIAQFDVLAEVRLEEALDTMLACYGDPTDTDDTDRDRRNSHTRFHEALVAGCRSEVLLNIRRQLFLQSERYLSLTKPLRHDAGALERDHRALVDAVRNRDADLASALLAEHIGETARLLLGTKINGHDLVPRA